MEPEKAVDRRTSTRDSGRRGTTGAKALAWRRPWAASSTAVALVLAAALLAALPAAATEVKISRLQSQEAFLKGTAEGVGVDPLGALRLAARAEQVAAISEPFVLAAAAHPDGWVVGTGNSGKVLLVKRDGAVEELFAAPEPEVFAVWADPDGTVFAGTSPNGKVYRIREGVGEPFFSPGETYVWRLTRDRKGRLLVATGTQGRLYRVSEAGEGSVLWDSDDTHVRSVAPLADGSVLAGTAGEGLIVRIDERGQAATVHDAAHPEVVDLVVAPDGSSWAAVVASEASKVDLAAAKKEEKKEESSDGSGDGAEVVVVADADPASGTIGSRPPGFQGSRSEILRIDPTGSSESMWSFEDETVFSLAWATDRLWVGTGLEGKLYSLQGGQAVLENDIDERQIVALVAGDGAPAFATTNGGAFFRLSEKTDRTGRYTSPVLDAGQVARFGTLSWRGETPKGSRVSFTFRCGNSAEPDDSWSPWSTAGEGAEVGLAEAPHSRYFQWRAELEGKGGATATLTSVSVSYRQENLRPKIEALEAMEPGQILVPYNFNPANQVYEPAHPNRDGIFTSLEPAKGTEDGRFKTLWKRGYLTLRWQATDPNGDELEYDLDFRPEDGGSWLPVASELSELTYSFDATVLPDGVYRFRLRASDRPANSGSEATQSERVSEPVVVDHSAPRVVRTRRGDGGALEVEVEDEQSPLREAVFSHDAGEWRPAEARDGLVDGRAETLLVDAPATARLLLLRLTDAAFNVRTVDLSGAQR